MRPRHRRGRFRRDPTARRSRPRAAAFEPQPWPEATIASIAAAPLGRRSHRRHSVATDGALRCLGDHADEESMWWAHRRGHAANLSTYEVAAKAEKMRVKAVKLKARLSHMYLPHTISASRQL